jgi:hypothetical protein
MYLKDETLKIILDYFQISEEEKAVIIEQIRTMQIELIIKSFLIYYETHKSPIELKYMDEITQGLKQEPKKYFQKFKDLFTAEANNNPEMIVFVEQRMIPFIVDLLREFSKGKDREIVRKVVENILEHYDLVEILNEQKQQASTT